MSAPLAEREGKKVRHELVNAYEKGEGGNLKRPDNGKKWEKGEA